MKTRRASGFMSRSVALAAPFIVACGGGSAAEPPPVSPEAPAAETPAAADPAAPAAAPAMAEKKTEGGDAANPPADLGEGDSRNTDSIAEVIKAHRKDARACYEKAQKQIPGLKGDVVIHFTLTPAGKVKQAELNKERSTITEASVSSCVIDVIRALEFPKSAKGLETTVNYPFNFTP